MPHLYQQILEHLFDGVYTVDDKCRITYWNSAAERITGYSRNEVLGRCCSDNILRHVDAKGHSLCRDSCPLTFTLADGQDREAEVFLHRKDGVRQPVRVRVIPMGDADGKPKAALAVFSDASERLRLLRRLEDIQRDSLTDPLTGAANRRRGQMFLETCLHLLQDHGQAFGVLMADLDNFKRFNDTHGHQAGDRLLRAVAGSLQNCLRAADCLCRWGGEEFLVVVPTADVRGLEALAERMRRIVASTWIECGGQEVHTTISIGGAFMAETGSLDGLVELADHNLYVCKDAGRDCARVTVLPPSRRVAESA